LFCDPAGIISQAHDPFEGDPTSQTMPQQAASHLLFSSQNLSLMAYSAHKITNAPFGASFVL
jgi:hypothetical protein